MRILHIHPSMAGGGIESMICALANEMSKTEDVTVCSIFEPVDTDTFWFKLNDTVKKETLGKKNAGFSFKILIDIYRYIRKGHFSVVNLHGMFYYYALSVLFLHSKTRFFYTVHSDANMENTAWDRKILALKKMCFQKDWMHAITISNVSQKSFSELYHAPNNLIFNGVPRPQITKINPVQEFRLTNNTKIFIHAGRISLPKNQLVLCKVFKRLIDDGQDVVLLIAGSKQSDKIFNTIRHYFCDRIVYLGQRDDVHQLMAYSDAMCLPSIWEGLPVTLLESLSVGCVPICSSVGGIPDVIESGKNGFLSATSLEEDYYRTMNCFLSLTDDDYMYIKKVCRVSFEKYDIVNTVKSYINVYNEK